MPTIKVPNPEFFMLHVEGRRGAKKRHDSQASAEAEAQRLRDECGARQDIFVMAPVAVLKSKTLSIKRKESTQ